MNSGGACVSVDVSCETFVMNGHDEGAGVESKFKCFT